MIVRCATCNHLFRQVLAAQTDCPRCERAPARPVAVEPEPTPGWRTCVEEGCGVSFRLERKRGRPAKRCPQHQKRAA